MILLHLWRFSKSCVSKLKATNHFMVLIQWLHLARQRFQLFISDFFKLIFKWNFEWNLKRLKIWNDLQKSFMRKWRLIIFSTIQTQIRWIDGLQLSPQISKSVQFHRSKIGFQLSKNAKLSGSGSFSSANTHWLLNILNHVIQENEPLKVKRSRQQFSVTIKNSRPRQRKFIQRNSKRKIFQNLLKNHPGRIRNFAFNTLVIFF